MISALQRLRSSLGNSSCLNQGIRHRYILAQNILRIYFRRNIGYQALSTCQWVFCELPKGCKIFSEFNCKISRMK